MKLETYLPIAQLKPFVKCFIIVDCSIEVLNSMLPDTSLIMGFRYKGITRYLHHDVEDVLPFAVVAGLRKSVQLMKDSTNTGNLLAIFHPGGARAFVREPLQQLFGEVVSLNEIATFKQLNEIEDKLCSAKSDQQRVQVVEQFLLSKLYDYKHDPVSSLALQIIKSHNGQIRIKDLAGKLFISLDVLEKRMRQTIGASPKQVCNIVRMNALIQNMGTTSFLENALEAGYYDQAHFNKDFKTFTGQTPTDFLKSTL